MKSLVLKDIYNIGSTAKSLILIFLVFTLCLPSFGVTGYIFAVSMVVGMLNITTFNFDNACKWDKFALVMPVSRNQVVLSKFITLMLFSGAGTLFAMVIGITGGFIMGELVAFDSRFFETLAFGIAAFAVANVIGSLSIPLIIKYGPETARFLTLGSALIPVGIGIGVYFLLKALGVVFTDQLIFILICCSPAIAFVWNFVVYKIACRMYAKKEL